MDLGGTKQWSLFNNFAGSFLKGKGKAIPNLAYYKPIGFQEVETADV
jgi:hypothetical protein